MSGQTLTIKADLDLSVPVAALAKVRAALSELVQERERLVEQRAAIFEDYARERKDVGHRGDPERVIQLREQLREDPQWKPLIVAHESVEAIDRDLAGIAAARQQLAPSGAIRTFIRAVGPLIDAAQSKLAAQRREFEETALAPYKEAFSAIASTQTALAGLLSLLHQYDNESIFDQELLNRTDRLLSECSAVAAQSHTATIPNQ